MINAVELIRGSLQAAVVGPQRRVDGRRLALHAAHRVSKARQSYASNKNQPWLTFAANSFVAFRGNLGLADVASENEALEMHMGRTPNDDRSDSMNPNNDAYDDANDNHSNQLNPNNERYQGDQDDAEE